MSGFDINIQFCNKAEDVVCSTMGEKDISKALDIMEQTRELELRLKEIESHLTDTPKNNEESDLDSLISLVL